jgi:hypothetical protein
MWRPRPTGTLFGMTTASTSPTTRSRTTHLRRALVVLGAVVAALAVWVVADPLAGATVTVHQDGGAEVVGVRAVTLTALGAGLLGWALLAVLERFVRRPRAVWTVTAVVVLALSLLAPFGYGQDTATRVALTAMHLAVGAVLVTGLPRR